MQANTTYHSILFVSFLTLLVACGGTPSGDVTTPSECVTADCKNAEPAPTKPDAQRCEAYRGNNCPSGCVQACVGSCDTCDDCNGPGSCRTPETGSPDPRAAEPASCQPGQFRTEVPEEFRRCESDSDCTQVSVGCCAHERVIVGTAHRACVASLPCNQEPGTFACIAIAVELPQCRQGLCQ